MPAGTSPGVRRSPISAVSWPKLSASVIFLYSPQQISHVALSACAPDFNPAPDYKGGYLWDSDRSRTVTVEAGAQKSLASRGAGRTASAGCDAPVTVQVDDCVVGDDACVTAPSSQGGPSYTNHGE